MSHLLPSFTILHYEGTFDLLRRGRIGTLTEGDVAYFHQQLKGNHDCEFSISTTQLNSQTVWLVSYQGSSLALVHFGFHNTSELIKFLSISLPPNATFFSYDLITPEVRTLLESNFAYIPSVRSVIDLSDRYTLKPTSPEEEEDHDF